MVRGPQSRLIDARVTNHRRRLISHRNDSDGRVCQTTIISRDEPDRMLAETEWPRRIERES